MTVFPPYPNPVDDNAARVVAGEVLALNAVAFGLRQRWLFPYIAADFVTRTAIGPRFSPLAMLAQRVILPRLGTKRNPTPGPPKRFAAGIGAVLMVAASLLQKRNQGHDAIRIIGALMLAFPALESILGLCVGCKMFSLLMRAGIIPESVCEECANIELRRLRVREQQDEDAA